VPSALLVALLTSTKQAKELNLCLFALRGRELDDSVSQFVVEALRKDFLLDYKKRNNTGLGFSALV